MKINSPHVSHESVDGEVVIVNLENGAYYSLIDLAARIWEAIAAGASRQGLLTAVTSSYPDDSEALPATERFLDDLFAEGLIVPGDSPAEAAPRLSQPWAPPYFEKFTDMQEILMLDPIHEVGEPGWPHKP